MTLSTSVRGVRTPRKCDERLEATFRKRSRGVAFQDVGSNVARDDLRSLGQNVPAILFNAKTQADRNDFDPMRLVSTEKLMDVLPLP